jgi:hypothetical protein
MLWSEPEKISLIVLDLNKAKNQSIDIAMIDESKGSGVGIGMTTIQFQDYTQKYENVQWIELVSSGTLVAELKISIRTYGLLNN